jgi:hypothetical protein
MADTSQSERRHGLQPRTREQDRALLLAHRDALRCDLKDVEAELDDLETEAAESACADASEAIERDAGARRLAETPPP